MTLVELEFDTGTKGGALLGDIASSLVCLDELLRDLGSIAADPSGAEFRNIEIVAIEMRSPLTIRLSLVGISPEAIDAFLKICRDVILSRESRLPAEIAARTTEHEARRLYEHIGRLQRAEIPLKRIEVKDAGPV